MVRPQSVAESKWDSMRSNVSGRVGGAMWEFHIALLHDGEPWAAAEGNKIGGRCIVINVPRLLFA